jgi:hypothetical protein
MPENKPNAESDPDGSRRPLKFFAVANANLMRGELVEFHVDVQGKIMSPKLDFI